MNDSRMNDRPMNGEVSSLQPGRAHADNLGP